jgi:hypothetical protein
MSRSRWAGLLAVAVLALPAPEARAVDQATIDRAIERGVAGLRRLQQGDGTWPHVHIGATALAGLTLRECGARADDKAARQAAAAVRQASLNLTHTYSLALCVLFLDRLDDPADTPLIESMLVRLLAGQHLSGGWAYNCPEVGAAEVRRLSESVRRVNELVGRRELPELPPLGKRTAKDLPKAIREQLAAVARVGPRRELLSDNSNTQFATLALWVGRRYGLPVQAAMERVEARFRRSQNPDGSWGYVEPSVAPGRRPGPPGGLDSGGTASMTCAGLLGLAAAHGSAADLRRARDPRAKPRDVSKDAQLRKGLQALAAAVGRPTGAWKGPRVAPQAAGKAYYFLWSLERVAVALSLETVGKKDWYNWGAEVLLANQQADGTWHGEYGTCGADTCFALLFLKRANLASDLTASIGGVADPGEKVLRSGGVGGGALKGAPGLKPTDIGEKTKPGPGPKAVAKGAKEPPAPRPKEEKESAASRLGRELVAGSPARRAAALERLRQTKGVDYTEALVGAIPRLEGGLKRKAREALAERLARMKATTLRTYLKDEEAELRRAAALACASKESKELIPDLIGLLSDPEPAVERAAHAALKDLSGKDFGPAAAATRAERARAAAEWRAWWRKQTRE